MAYAIPPPRQGVEDMLRKLEELERRVKKLEKKLRKKKRKRKRRRK